MAYHQKSPEPLINLVALNSPSVQIMVYKNHFLLEEQGLLAEMANLRFGPRNI